MRRVYEEYLTEWTMVKTGFWLSGQLCVTNRAEVPEVLTALLIAEEHAVPILSCSKRDYSWATQTLNTEISSAATSVTTN